jgi:hypothetical protein
LEVTWTGDWTAEAEGGSRKLNFFFADGAPYLKLGVQFYSLSSTDTSVQIDHLSRGITTAYGAWRSRRLVQSIIKSMEDDFASKGWLVSPEDRPAA